MDGLLIDSEPLWYEAAVEVMGRYGLQMDETTYASTVGLRTKEFLEHWFNMHGLNAVGINEAEQEITDLVIDKVKKRGIVMPGVPEAVELFLNRGYHLGLATSSPASLIDVVLKHIGLEEAFAATTSAEHLPFGKPHPQVYLDCAHLLGSRPVDCICLEDSFNGMLAAKSARMKCIVVPATDQIHQPRWAAADACIPSLVHLTPQLLDQLSDV